MSRIETLRAVKQAIRQPYAWPGGYPLYILMSDGEALSCTAARQEWRQIVYATLHGLRDGWQALGVDVNWEDTARYCAHTNERIPSAYGDEY